MKDLAKSLAAHLNRGGQTRYYVTPVDGVLQVWTHKWIKKIEDTMPRIWQGVPVERLTHYERSGA